MYGQASDIVLEVESTMRENQRFLKELSDITGRPLEQVKADFKCVRIAVLWVWVGVGVGGWVGVKKWVCVSVGVGVCMGGWVCCVCRGAGAGLNSPIPMPVHTHLGDRRDFYLSAEESVEYGMVDQVIIPGHKDPLSVRTPPSFLCLPAHTWSIVAPNRLSHHNPPPRTSVFAPTPSSIANLFARHGTTHGTTQIAKRDVGFGKFASGDDQKYQPAFMPPSWS